MSFNNKLIKLHLGCGENYLKGYINIDFPQAEHPLMKVKADIYKDIRELDYPENSVEEIRNHHLLEHFSRQEALKLLLQWQRWLKPGGLLVIETPDFENSIKEFLKTKDLRKKFQLTRHIFGSHEAKWAYHKDGWYKEKFEFILKKMEFEDIKTIQMANNLSKHLGYHFSGPLNEIGEILPEKYLMKIGFNKLPHILCTAKKSQKEINEEKILKEILSLSLVGKEDKIFEAWLKDIKKNI